MKGSSKRFPQKLGLIRNGKKVLPYRMEVLVEHKILTQKECDRFMQMVSSKDVELRQLGEVCILKKWEEYYLAESEE